MNFINSQFEDFKTITEKLLKQNAKLEEKNEELEKEVAQVKRAFVITKKQYGRMDCVEFGGIPQNKDENPDRLIIKMGDMLGIHVDAKDFWACHQLGKKQDAPIIAKFLNRKRATSFLGAKKLAKKPIKGECISLEDPQEFDLYISESLTKQNKEVLYMFERKKKKKRVEVVWSRNGVMYVRKNENSDFIRINCKKDIEQIN